VIEPTTYEGTAVVDGKVKDFIRVLDPQNWKTTAPEIWKKSHLIEDVKDEDVDNKTAQLPAKPVENSNWDNRLLYESALFGPFTFNNLLRTSCEASADGFDMRYSQFTCLNTEANRMLDGGIDVDFGFSRCSPAGGGQVRLEIGKTVRFTQPSDPDELEELNTLAHVMIPLSFDLWLHSLLFPRQTPGEPDGNEEPKQTTKSR
jgi:hypothetical protein